MRKWKWISLIFSALILSIFFTVSAYAATSDVLIDNNVIDSAIARYGAAYDTPFVPPEGAVDSSNGAVSTVERDLALPGKNGLDVDIYRKHSSYDFMQIYDILSNSITLAPNMLAVPYNVTVDGKDQVCYVGYIREEEIEETIQSRKIYLTPEYDANGLPYIKRSRLKSGTEVTLTWNRDIEPKTIWKAQKMSPWGAKKYEIDSNNVKIGPGWYICMPSIAYMNETKAELGPAPTPTPAPTATATSKPTSTPKPTSKTTQHTMHMEISFEDGSVENMRYSFRDWPADDGKPAHYEFLEAWISNGNSNYTVEMLEEPCTDSRGFTYNVKVIRRDGKTYYFYFSDPYTYPQGEIAAVSDRYNKNVILYEKIQSGWLITDTYNRKIKVTGNGIQVDAGDMSKKISYATETIPDLANNPHGYYDTFDTKKFTVSEYTGNEDTARQTVYSMKYKTAVNGVYYNKNGYADKELLVPVITEIQYPTNVRREYFYEETPEAPLFFGVRRSYSFDDTGDYYLYRVTGEKLYENDILKSDKQYSYEGRWGLPRDNYVLELENYKAFKTFETLENGHTKESAQRYDCAGKLISTETTFKDTNKKTYTQEEKFGYYNGYIDVFHHTKSDLRKLRQAALSNTLIYQDGILLSSKDTGYQRETRAPTLTEQGEIQTTYEYDTAGFYLPLTQTTKQLNQDVLRQVNTLSSDKKSIMKTEIFDKNNTLQSTTEYTYNPDGTVASQIVSNDGGKNVTTVYAYQYNADSSYAVTSTVQNVKDADGQTRTVSTTTQYDPLGRKSAETDGNGNTTQYEYDMLGQVTKQINPDGTSQQVTYDIANNIITVTDENGSQTTKAYSPRGNLEKIYLDQDPSKAVGEYTYDNLGRKLTESAYMEFGGTPVTNEYTYDDLNRPVTVTSKDGNTVLDVASSSYTFEPETIKNIYVDSSSELDVSGFKKAEIILGDLPYGLTWGESNYQILLDGSRKKSGHLYSLDRKTETLDLTGASTLKLTSDGGTYKAIIRLLPNDSEINLLGGASQVVTTSYKGDYYYEKPTTVTTVDGYGNTVSEAYYKWDAAPENLLNKNVYQYDYQGNVLESLGGRTYMEKLGDYTTKVEYDYAGRPLKQYQAGGSYTSTVYDKLGNAVSTTDFLGNTTSYQYDQLGRVLKTTAPFDGTYTSEALTYYDNNSNIVMTKQQNNKPGEAVSYAVTENEYDSRNRLVSTRVNDGTRDIYTQYAYDNVGNMVRW